MRLTQEQKGTGEKGKRTKGNSRVRKMKKVVGVGGKVRGRKNLDPPNVQNRSTPMSAFMRYRYNQYFQQRLQLLLQSQRVCRPRNSCAQVYNCKYAPNGRTRPSRKVPRTRYPHPILKGIMTGGREIRRVIVHTNFMCAERKETDRLSRA
jgi:hypothetical protein